MDSTKPTRIHIPMLIPPKTRQFKRGGTHTPNFPAAILLVCYDTPTSANRNSTPLRPCGSLLRRERLASLAHGLRSVPFLLATAAYLRKRGLRTVPFGPRGIIFCVGLAAHPQLRLDSLRTLVYTRVLQSSNLRWVWSHPCSPQNLPETGTVFRSQGIAQRKPTRD